MRREACRGVVAPGKLAAAAGNAPALPVSETGVLLPHSAAVLAGGGGPPRDWSPHPELHGLIRLPSEGIADNALRAIKMASLTGFAPVISCMKGRRVGWATLQGRPGNGGGRRNRAFDLMPVMHPLWLTELCPRMKMERVDGVAPSSRPWHGRILLLNHTRENPADTTGTA